MLHHLGRKILTACHLLIISVRTFSVCNW